MLDKSIDGPSKILTRKWNFQNQQHHFDKLAHMKATFNIGNEGHLMKFNKKKANIMQEERCTEIERENRILFEKLARIKLVGNSSNANKKNIFFQSKIANEPSSTRYLQRDTSMILRRKQEQRQREKKRIFNENMKMLERLRNSKGTVDSNSFVVFEAQHKENLKRLQEFNSPINQSGVTMRKNNLSTLDKASPLKLPNFSTHQETIHQSNEKQDSSYRRKTKRKHKRVFNQIDRNLTPFHSNQMPDLFSKRELDYSHQSQKLKKLLYKCRIVIDQRGKQMDLEMWKDNKKFYIKAMPIHHKERQQEIELHLKQAQQLLLQYDNDYETFVNDSLYFKNGKFLLKDLNKQKYNSVVAINKRTKDRSNSQSISKEQFYNQEQIKGDEEQKLPDIRLVNQTQSMFDQGGDQNIIRQEESEICLDGIVKQSFSFSQNDPPLQNIDQITEQNQ